jgi:hypothetical protein
MNPAPAVIATACSEFLRIARAMLSFTAPTTSEVAARAASGMLGGCSGDLSMLAPSREIEPVEQRLVVLVPAPPYRTR